MNRSAVRLVAAIFVVLLLAVGAGTIVVWWKIAELKKSLVQDLEKALGAKIEVASIDIDLWQGELHAAGISMINERPDAPWEKGEISQAAAHFHLADLFNSPLPLTVEVSSWNVVLHPTTSETESSVPSPNPVAEPGLSSPPAKKAIQVTQLSAREGEVEIHLSGGKEIILHGVAFRASDNGAGVWTTDLQASSVVAGSLETGASSVQIRGDHDKLSFTDLRMPCGQGFITGDGEWALSDRHETRISLKATGVPVTMLIGAQWQMKLSGLIAGELKYEGDDLARTAHGQLQVDAGKFNVLPWLGKVTALVNLPDITDVELDKATSNFEWKNGALHLSNLDIRKNDVTRIGGNLDVDPRGQVDGRLKLGLPSAVTARWPALQDKVFSDQHDDFNWTDVHLTGTPDHLQEDLTARLLTIGEEEGSGVLNQTSQKALDLLKTLMNN